jgi:phosphoribosylformimino-5-aminoimidazole carboxamide ribotide isomerase
VIAPTLYPAIDILGGQAVRLTLGSFDQSKVYDEPLAAARRWAEEGAEALHVVDLDGARAGHPVSLAHLRSIAELGRPVQYGGGLRSMENVADAIAQGATRVVLGTAAYRDPELLAAALDRFGSRVIVSVDVRGGRVATAGWLDHVELTAAEAVKALESRGVERFVYTNVDRDGTLEGVDPDDVHEISQAVGAGRFVFSGGVGSIDDLTAIAHAHAGNLEGVIVGKALYENRFRLRDAKRALEASRETAEWS